jgi:hypothetical protein
VCPILSSVGVKYIGFCPHIKCIVACYLKQDRKSKNIEEIKYIDLKLKEKTNI